MTRAEMELSLVLNAADADEGHCLISSTWPRWTRLLDKLVTFRLATCDDIHDRAGNRLGGRYRIDAGIVRIAFKKPTAKRTVSEDRRATLRENLAHARAARRAGSQKFIESKSKNAQS
jgi:hypothetical protein